MGKHDSDEGMGFFLGGAEGAKDGALWLLHNLKIVFLVALIPAIGFGAYYATKYIVNKKNSKPAYSLASGITNDEEKNKEYVGGYEVLGEIKAEKAGVDVKILNPEIDGKKYIEDGLKNGAIYYYGEELDELTGNTVILGHNSADSFFGLKELEIDDSITVINGKGDSKDYTIVEKTNCEPDDFSKFVSTDDNSKEITLITCETEGTQRLVLRAVSK